MATLLALALTSRESQAAPCNSRVDNDVVVAEKAPGLNTQRLVESVAEEMQTSNVKGYALNVFNRWGQSVASITHGLARTACDTDGEQRFTLNTETPWGSVSKLLTTAAAVHAVEEYGGVDFDDPIVDYLPYRWRPELSERLQDVTVEMLLQHKAGFRKSGCGRPVRDRLADGDALNGCGSGNPRPAVGTRQYSNTGPGIFYVILAYMVAPDFMHYVDFGYQDSTDAVYDEVIQGYTAAIYNDYVQAQVLDPVGATATCNMVDNLGGNYTLWYSSASDSSGSMPSDQSGHCASGGWSLSSNEMARVLNRLRNSDDILTREAYAQMESSSENSLGWWRTSMNHETAYSHNGAWGSTRAQVYSLPGGYTATLVTNSPPAGDISLGGVLSNAFRDARQSGLAQDFAAVYRLVLE